LAPRALPRFFATISPSETLSSSTDFPVSPVIRLPCSADFAAGRGGLLQLLCLPLPSCCRYHPARVSRCISQLATIHAAFTLPSRARPLGLFTFEANCVHFRYGPMAHDHPKDGLVDRFQRFSFLPPCYPSYEASDSCLGGSYLPLNMPAFAGHTTVRESLDSYRSYRSAIPGQVIAQCAKSDGFCCAMRRTHARAFVWLPCRRLYFRRAHRYNA
jgi:hypothetical protein